MKLLTTLMGSVILVTSALYIYNSDDVSSSGETPLYQVQSVVNIPAKVEETVSHTTAEKIAGTEINEIQTLTQHRFREDVYDQVLIDANSSAQSIDRQSLKTFWMAAVDFKQYGESIEVLDSIINSTVTDEALIGDAERYREDLLKLSQPAELTTTMTWALEETENNGNLPEGGISETPNATLDLIRIDELAYRLRHGELEQVSAAINELSLHRDSQVTELLLQNVDFLPAAQYKKVLRTLWYSAADNIDSERITTFVDLAQLSNDNEVAELAALAYADLHRPDEPTDVVLMEDGIDPATGCSDLEVCGQ